ncbi:non-hydrolyzing UDP-N-acetylglucosamine 2-epimerase [Psychrobacillus sp. FSL K6-1464]|uniref:non-hydrolyzing UDP-N-acetylglucosamine 2-epimerase n=1 Tax=Psychrobacillus sp. FSL K6-1464 TaxID=2921545 RepID=UPI0030FA45AF
MKVLIIFGTRPEGIKFAPIIQELVSSKEMDCILVNTGQHREILDQVLSLFSIRPHYQLNLMKPNQTLEEITAEMIKKIGEVYEKESPDLVLVLGDTVTTFTGAYTAFLHRIPVGHVEAGLRTFNMYSPFPEEMYRKLVTSLSSYHFAPTEKSKTNLLHEGIPENSIFVVGNPVIDALLDVSSRPYIFPPNIQKIIDNKRRIILVTTHRRENFIKLEGIYLAFKQLLVEFEDIDIIFPVHPNPNVKKQVQDHLITNNINSRIHLIEPLDYECFSHLMKLCHLVITDSGGIQEEAPALNVPVLVVRESTERIEGIEAGTLQLVGTDKEKILATTRKLLESPSEHAKIAKIPNPYGDGTSAKQIIELLKNIEKKL